MYLLLKKITLKEWFILILFAVCLVLPYKPNLIEQYYTNGVYLLIKKLQFLIFSHIPFSVGDCLYVIAALILCYKIFLLCLKIYKKQISKPHAVWLVKKIIFSLLMLYVLFNLIWALNYYRVGAKKQLRLSTTNYTTKELEQLVCFFIQELNATRAKIGTDTLQEVSTDTILKHIEQAFNSPVATLSFLQTKQIVKQSLFSKVSHYIGFTGYYNPFTGESQISTNVPNITIPFTAAHEIAHQLGYAREDEANFIAFLMLKYSTNKYYYYSMLIEMYRYAAMELFITDNGNTHAFELLPAVRKDLKAVRDFFAQQENNISPLMSQLYNGYLKMQQQTNGIKTYTEVIGLTINYYKKYGWQ